MFSMTKSRLLDEVQSEDGDVNKRQYGEDVKFYQKYCLFLSLCLSSYPKNCTFTTKFLPKIIPHASLHTNVSSFPSWVQHKYIFSYSPIP